MAIYVIADLHLSLGTNKPMDIFGENWVDHDKKIKNNWLEKVTDNDYVILPGDFSWATYLEETKKDFEYLNSLPGKKIMLKGNHDFWWTTVTSMRRFLQENNFNNIDFIYNNSYECENYIITGTRGWGLTEEHKDEKILNRELARLENSIKDGINKFGKNKEILVFMHYPPITNTVVSQKEETSFINIMKKYNVKRCFYGHLHGDSINGAIQGNISGIAFKLVSADGLDFKLYKIEG